MKIIWIIIGLTISGIAMADDYPCSKGGIEKVVERKINLGQAKSAVLDNLNGKVIQNHQYPESPLEYDLNGKKITAWAITKIDVKQCRSIKSFFLIKSNFIVSLFFDKEDKLLASEVIGYHDSL